MAKCDKAEHIWKVLRVEALLPSVKMQDGYMLKFEHCDIGTTVVAVYQCDLCGMEKAEMVK